MKAQELRIGNWLQRLDGSLFQVTVQDFMLMNNMPEYLNPKPIPLTEEWLLKFGFKLDSYSKYFERWGKDVVYIEKINGNYHHDYVAVGAVHTLQNLYFALTGEELTFIES